MEINEIINSIWGPDWKEKIPKKKVSIPNSIIYEKKSRVRSTIITKEKKIERNFYPFDSRKNIREDDPSGLYNKDSDLDSNSLKKMTTEVRRYGIEALAFYVSFHADPHNWGIYLRVKGIKTIAQSVFKKAGVNPHAAIQQSKNFLFHHEFFHFLTDVGIAVMEAPSDFQLNYWNYYKKKILASYNESIANAYALKEFQKEYRHTLTGEIPELKKWMKKQPLSYTKFDNYSTPENFILGLRKLGNDITSFGRNQNCNPPLELLFDVAGISVTSEDVPVRIIRI